MQHVFVSYSHEDNDFAQLLRTQLQNAGIQTWLALDNLKTGEDWREGIDEAIKQSFAVIVIISPTSNESKYVTYEWALGYGFGIPIIPILYKLLSAENTLHPRLETLQYEDFSPKNNRPWVRLVDRLREIYAKALQKEQLDPKIQDAIQALTSDWDSSRIVRAAEFLGRRKAQSATPQLIRLLDEPLEIQKAAIKALGEIGDTTSTEKLIDFVDKEETRLDAIEALGKIGDTKAAPVLIEQAKSNRYRIKFNAISALEKMEMPEVKEFLFDMLLTGSYFCEEDSDDEFDYDSNKIVKNIFHVLANKIDQEDADQLLLLLDEKNNSIVNGSIKLLAELQAKKALIPILRLTRGNSPLIRDSAMSALDKLILGFREHLDKLASEKHSEQCFANDYFYEHFGIAGLIYALGYPRSNAYWQTALKIEDVVTPVDLPKLIDGLHDTEGRVRGLIAEVIGRKNLRDCQDKLKLLADDPVPFVRGLAIRAIGNLQHRNAIRQLKARLKDSEHIFSNSDNQVRDFAAIALAKLKSKSAIPRLQELCLNSNSDLQDEAIDLIISLGELTNRAIFESSLHSEDKSLWLPTLKILAAIEKGIDLTSLLLDLQQDSSDEYRTVIDKLKELYPPMGLIVALTADNKRYWEIAEALQHVIQPKDLPLIQQLLKAKHYRVRAYLAEIAGLRPDLEMGENIIQLVDDNVPFVRGLAIRALSRLNYFKAKDCLEKCLDDTATIYSGSNIRVCDYAVLALVKLEKQIFAQLTESLQICPREILRELLGISRSTDIDFCPIIPELIGLLETYDKNILPSVIDLLAEIKAKDAVNNLLPYLLDDDYRIIASVRSAIFKLGSKELIPQLFSLLWQAENLEKSGAHIVYLIQELGSATDAPLLLDFFANSSYTEWYSVSHAISKLADTTIKFKVLDLLDTDNEELQIICLEILRMHGDKTIIEKLLDLLTRKKNSLIVFRIINVIAEYADTTIIPLIASFNDAEDEAIRHSVVTAYGKLKDAESVLRILPFFEDESYQVRIAAVQALIELGEPENLNIILKNMKVWENEKVSLEFEEYNITCIKAIGQLGNSSNIELLGKIALEHENPDYRAAAATALGNIGNESCVDILVEKLSDKQIYGYLEPVCHVAAKMLQRIGTEKAQNALNEWLSQLPESEKNELYQELNYSESHPF